MADRYAGRHIRQTRQARHGAWVTKKRTRSKSAQMVPTAAAFTVAGVLIGGAGTVIQLGGPAVVSTVDSPSYDAANYPVAHREAALEQASGKAGRVASTDADGIASMVMIPAFEADALPVAARAAVSVPALTNIPVILPIDGGPLATANPAPADEPAADPAPTGATPDTPSVVIEGSCEATTSEWPGQDATGGLSAASATLPVNTEVLVTNEATGDSVTVVITNRGTDGCLSLSSAAFAQIAPVGGNAVDVHYAVLAQDAT